MAMRTVAKTGKIGTYKDAKKKATKKAGEKTPAFPFDDMAYHLEESLETVRLWEKMDYLPSAEEIEDEVTAHLEHFQNYLAELAEKAAEYEKAAEQDDDC